MEVFLIKAFQLILSLSILVVLHELGHFIPAKLFKTRVEKFYLFFDVWFSLFKKKVGDSEYGVGWLPLGGYVKISGMIDESMDNDQLKTPAKSWEFRSKPAWQRLIIMLGGVTVNVLLAIFIYSMILFAWGDTYLPNKNLTHGVSCSDFAKSVGFNDGDKIVEINGDAVTRFADVNPSIILQDDPFVVAVERGGVLTNVNIGKGFIRRWKDAGKDPLFYVRDRVYVDSILPGKMNGVLKGDVLVSINNVSTPFFGDFKQEIKGYKNQTVELGVLRGDVDSISVSCLVSNEGELGFIPGNRLSLETRYFNIFSSFGAGYKLSVKKLDEYISQFALIFNSENNLAGEIGGFGAIGNLFPSSWDWRSFWALTAFLSLMLAFLNLLPIPALDGGHVMFLIYEILVGKPAPQKVIEYCQIVGMILLLGLVVFANGNDVLKLFK